MTHSAFFGDAEHAFKLTPVMITELERVTGVGIGSLCRRLSRGDFALAEITETIRLAMIGAGTGPAEAAALVKSYIPARPLAEAHILAADILDALYSGPKSAPGTKGESENG